jgi:hypothetical protein
MTLETVLHKWRVFRITRLVATSFGLLLVAASRATSLSKFATLSSPYYAL